MNTWICLLRGINVGGRNVVPMKSLVNVLSTIGCVNVSTYIQSGNVVFQHRSDARERLQSGIEEAVGREFGFRPLVHLLAAETLEDVVNDNPFPTDDPKALHVFFLTEQPASPDLTGMNEIRAASEGCDVGAHAVYLHAPDGIGRSKLAARIEKLVGVPATARNWRTVCLLRSAVEFTAPPRPTGGG